MTGYSDVFYTTAKVDFVDYYDSLENAIKDYVIINKPFDKAGAYSIRDIDPRFVRSITGDINTIIGLRVAEVAKRIFTNN
ncbi:Maf family protein [Streptococcus agalactiae]